MPQQSPDVHQTPSSPYEEQPQAESHKTNYSPTAQLLFNILAGNPEKQLVVGILGQSKTPLSSSDILDSLATIQGRQTENVDLRAISSQLQRGFGGIVSAIKGRSRYAQYQLHPEIGPAALAFVARLIDIQLGSQRSLPSAFGHKSNRIAFNRLLLLERIAQDTGPVPARTLWIEHNKMAHLYATIHELVESGMLRYEPAEKIYTIRPPRHKGRLIVLGHNAVHDAVNSLLSDGLTEVTDRQIAERAATMFQGVTYELIRKFLEKNTTRPRHVTLTNGDHTQQAVRLPTPNKKLISSLSRALHEATTGQFENDEAEDYIKTVITTRLERIRELLQYMQPDPDAPEPGIPYPEYSGWDEGRRKPEQWKPLLRPRPAVDMAQVALRMASFRPTLPRQARPTNDQLVAEIQGTVRRLHSTRVLPQQR